MDACTASMCDKKWGRPGFAKVLVDVWATGELRKELEVIIPHLHDEGNDKIKVGVEYVWEPSQCSLCCVFGHKRSSCPKAVRLTVQNQKKPVMDDQGFTRVERKQWRRKEVMDKSDTQNAASSSGTKDDSSSTPIETDLVHTVEISNPDKEPVRESTPTVPMETHLDHDTGAREEERDENLRKELERKRLGLEFTLPEPPSMDSVLEEGSPPRVAQMIPPPKAPIKGILKNTHRVGSGGPVRKETMGGRDDGNQKKRDSGEKGGKGPQTSRS